MNGAEAFIAGLRERGVEWMATLCGHGLDPLLEAARKAGVRLVDARNEQTCAYMADACGRLTRRPGVCAVSSGVAHVNALTGVANAWFDRAPMLLISGAASTATAGKGHFQDMDQVALARPLTKFSASIDDPSLTLDLLNEAWECALAAPQGPVHLMFPMDVQESDGGAARSATAKNSAEEFDVAEVARALAESSSPLVVAGSGVFYDGCGREMLRCCEKLHIPVMTPIWDRGVVDEPSPVFLGVIGAATGGPAILAEADCIVLAGAVVDYRDGYLEPPAVRPDARVVHMRSGWNRLTRGGSKKWLAECVRRRDEFRLGVERRAAERQDGLHAIDVMRAIREVLSEKPVLLVDGGSIGQWMHQLLCRDRYPGDWLTCGRSGVVGWGIGGAMAARLAYPERPVILLSGDGAFTFNVADLESAARQGLGFVAIVADDQAWGITRVGQMKKYGEAAASTLGPVAFDRLAESMGARGVRVDAAAEIAPALRRAMGESRVTVIHVPISGGNP